MIKIVASLLFIMLMLPASMHAQGCSDAGVCGIFTDTEAQTDKTSYAAGLSQYFGIGENSTGIFATNLSLEYKTREIELAVKIPYVYINGDLGDQSGIGDIILSAGYTNKLHGDFRYSYAVGIKFPTGEDNGAKSGLPLPMVYQTGGGTFDIMLGVSVSYNSWKLALGWQNPLGESSNSFLHRSWQGKPEALQYAESRNLGRGMDLMLALDKSFEFDGTWVYAGAIAIFRLTDSYYYDSDIDILSKKIAEKTGSTINFNLGIADKLNDYAMLFVEAAMPVVTRKTSADGLKRAFTGSLGLKFIL